MNTNNNVNLNDDVGQEANVAMTTEAPQERLLQVVWRRHWVVLIAVVVCLGGGFGYLQKATPIFSSTARLYVEQSGPGIMTEQDVFTQSKNYLYTQCALLGSTPILAAVIENPEIARLNVFANVDNPIGFLKKMVQAFVGKKDDIISVTFEAADPTEAAQVVNAVVDSYITYHAAQMRSTALEVLRILQNEKTVRDEELADRYQAILDFREANGALTLEDELDRPATLEEMCRALALPLHKVKIIARAVKAFSSPNQMPSSDESFTLNEMLEDNKTPRPDEAVFNADELETLARLLGEIDEREAEVLRLRFGLDRDKPLTLKEIGKQVGLTRERVRQIEKEALEKLNLILSGQAEQST